MNWYFQVLKNYFKFSGRARRMEYWVFTLVNLVISLALGVIGDAVLDNADLLRGIYSVAVLIPGIAVTVRRLHDINKSGWWLLIIFIPVVGLIWLIVLAAREGDYRENQYGPDPKEDGFEEKLVSE